MAELGRRKSMMNYSSDHPASVLEKANEELISGSVAGILNDEKLLSQMLDSSFEIVEEALSIEMQKYADFCGKSLENRRVFRVQNLFLLCLQIVYINPLTTISGGDKLTLALRGKEC